MKHNLKRVLHLTQARDFTVRAIRAWRNLLPDWTPTLDDLRELDTRPHEHVAAVRIVADGWAHNDARWDVLLALLEYERRQVQNEQWMTGVAAAVNEEIEEAVKDAEIVIPVTVVKEGKVVSESETTIETPLKALFLDRLAPVKHLSLARGSDE